jgi:hypothetical protein
MDITSLDNIVSPNGDPGDGLTLLAGQLARLRQPTAPDDDVLVCIIPEYERPVGAAGTTPGRLLRLDVITVNLEDPAGLTTPDAELFEAALVIAQQLSAKRAAAAAALNAPVPAPATASEQVQQLAVEIDAKAGGAS